MAEIALLGTGRMGAAMARRLADAGHRVRVWNRTLVSAGELVESRADGALVLATSAAEAVTGAAAVMTVLADGDVTAAVVLDESVMAALPPGCLVIDLGTSGVGAATALGQALHGAGFRFVDAPVSGSVPAVTTGTLLVMASGAPEDVAAATPLLLAFAAEVVRVGDVGAGQAMKLAVNLVVHDLNAALAEALELAARSGIDRADAYDVLEKSVVGAPFVRYKRAAFLDAGTPTAMSLALVAKDLGLITEHASHLGARLPVTEETRIRVQGAVDAGWGGRDMADLSRFPIDENGSRWSAYHQFAPRARPKVRQFQDEVREPLVNAYRHMYSHTQHPAVAHCVAGTTEALSVEELVMDSSTKASIAPRRSPLRVSRGLVTVIVALLLLVLAGFVFAPSSVSSGAIQGMLPFAAVLAIIALGQTLVVMQGGIDLSVPGSVSLVIVLVTHQAYGDDAKVLPVALLALGAALLTGLGNGFLIGRLGLNPIVATLGTNALLYAAVLAVSGGTPRETTRLLARLAGGTTLGVPHAVYVAVLATAVTSVLVKKTVAGRRFEAVGANGLAAWASGLRVEGFRAGGYVFAQVLYWLGALMLAGILNKPTAYQGDGYLLASVAAVVLGGTSLLGGRGNLVATALAALFLIQLDQFVLALGLDYAGKTLVQSAAFAIGVALYTINWARLRRRFATRRPEVTVAT